VAACQTPRWYTQGEVACRGGKLPQPKCSNRKALAAHVTVLPLLFSSVVVVLFMVRLFVIMVMLCQRRFASLGCVRLCLQRLLKGKLLVLDSLASTGKSAGKTAKLREQLVKLGAENALIIGGAELDASFVKAARNIPLVDVLPQQGINVYDILRRDVLVLSKDAAAHLEERLK
jgi:hypothetical protein